MKVVLHDFQAPFNVHCLMTIYVHFACLSITV